VDNIFLANGFYTEQRLADMMKELQSRSEAKIILESGTYALILFFRVRCKFYNSLDHGFKPSDAKTAEYVRGIARYLGLLSGSFYRVPLMSYRISNI